MRIRTQLLLAFLVLAILPMTAIVLFGYLSSQRAVREAVEREVSASTADMESRLAEVTGEMRERVVRIGALPFGRFMEDPDSTRIDSGGETAEFYGTLVGELGETAELVERLEFVPAPPAPALPPPSSEVSVEAPPTGEMSTTIVFEMHEIMSKVEESLRRVESESVRSELRKRAEEGIAAAAALEVMARQGDQRDSPGRAEWKISLEEGRVERDRQSAEVVRQDAPEMERSLRQQAPEEFDVAANRDFERFRVDFAEGLAIPVQEEGKVVGELRARVKSEHLLRRILGRTRRATGEIPFAVDREGDLFTLDEADRSVLETVPLGASPGDARAVDQWVVVTTDIPTVGMSLGIARPISDSLAELKRSALRNFGFGVALIGLALLGVVPMSRRLSSNVQTVTAAAEKIAEGDLSIRVPVKSDDEIGQLAAAFNSMTTDLAAHQERLVEEERSRRDHEIERQLLRAEVERKTTELEDARHFQLSLLPKGLPSHESFELAVEMKTATEVGGDYYDFQLAEDGTLTAAVGDATGHGARAGTMVTVIKSLFSAHPPGESLAEFLGEAGRAIRRMELGRMAMALTLMRFENGRLILAAAGMPPALLYRPGSRRVEEIQCTGMPLGSFDVDYREADIPVTRGDTLLLMTDGLPELPNADGEPFGYERCAAAFAACAEDPPAEVVEQLIAAATSWSAKPAPADDMTLLTLRVL